MNKTQLLESLLSRCCDAGAYNQVFKETQNCQMANFLIKEASTIDSILKSENIPANVSNDYRDDPDYIRRNAPEPYANHPDLKECKRMGEMLTEIMDDNEEELDRLDAAQKEKFLTGATFEESIPEDYYIAD